MLHFNSRIVPQPVSLSSFQLGEPPHSARLQQYVHPQKSQTRQHSSKRKQRCCTYATQSIIDALGGKGQSAPQRAWWNDHQELWAAVHSPEELDHELTGNGKDLVVVGGPNICTFSTSVLKSHLHFTVTVLQQMSLQTSMAHGVLVVLKCILRSAEWLQTQPCAKDAILLRYHAF